MSDMKVIPLTRLVQNKRPDKDWLYELQQDMIYQVIGYPLTPCNVWCDGLLLMRVRFDLITIKAGYAYNGMTLYPDTERNLPGAALHDGVYQTGVFPRKIGDLMLRAVCEHREAFHPELIYAGVRLGGKPFYLPNPDSIRIELLPV